MRFERSVTSISWIPSEAMNGLMKVPMDLGISHYDQPPPDHVVADDLERLRQDDRYRFANHLAGWIEVDDGAIVDAGYAGGGYVGSTVAKFGVTMKVPGVAFPVLQEPPDITGDRVVFRQTAGGRTGAPFPRRIDRPPYLRLTAPTAWTTLTLTVAASGDATHELVGASPFPRHWIYDTDGDLAAKSGQIDFTEWTRVHDHVRSPWHDYDRAALMSDVESQVERDVANAAMTGRCDMVRFDAGAKLIQQGQEGGTVYLVLDGMLEVSVDGEHVAELGPGAIVGERAVVEGGRATATVVATTPIRAAVLPVDVVGKEGLEAVASVHRGDNP